jgi:MFS transporter, DHA2 family, multidrug resistance protein
VFDGKHYTWIALVVLFRTIAWIGQQVQTQASFLGYVDAFWVLMLTSLVEVPLALTLRKVKPGGPVHMGH